MAGLIFKDMRAGGKVRGKASVEPEAPNEEPEKPYFNVSAPRPLMLRFEELVNEHPELGYTSASAAAIEGIRRFLLDLEEKLEKKAAIGKAVEKIGDVPLRIREQFAHEMILLAQRYLDKEKQVLSEAHGGAKKPDKK